MDTPPVNVNLEVKGTEKLFDIVRSWFGIKTAVSKATEEAKARQIEADAQRAARLLEAHTDAEIEQIKAKGAISVEKIQVEGAHEVAALQEALLAEYEVSLDELLPDPPVIELVEKDGIYRPFEAVEQRRYKNIKHVAQETLKALPEHTRVSDDDVDPDVVARIFGTVQDVSNEDMQKIWGRLLAGEIAQPGAFSLRTLDVLRNMSHKDAQLFERICPFTFGDGDIIDQGNIFFQSSAFRYIDVLRLEECGLLHRSMSWGARSGIRTTFQNSVSFLDKLLLLCGPDPNANLLWSSMRLTGAGCELRRLKKYAANAMMLQAIVKLAEEQGITATVIDPYQRRRVSPEDVPTE